MSKVVELKKDDPVVVFAREELSRLLRRDITPPSERSEQELMNKDILNLIKTVVDQKHKSPMELYYVLNTAQRLLQLKPLTPIMGTDEEWELDRTDIKTGYKLFHNKRCLSIKKEEDAYGNVVRYYDTEGCVCSFDGGYTWATDARFYKPLRFPYIVPEGPEQLYLKDVDGKIERIEDVEEINALYAAAEKAHAGK